jgi:hypothetical protein
LSGTGTELRWLLVFPKRSCLPHPHPLKHVHHVHYVHRHLIGDPTLAMGFGFEATATMRCRQTAF